MVHIYCIETPTGTTEIDSRKAPELHAAWKAWDALATAEDLLESCPEAEALAAATKIVWARVLSCAARATDNAPIMDVRLASE